MNASERAGTMVKARDPFFNQVWALYMIGRIERISKVVSEFDVDV